MANMGGQVVAGGRGRGRGKIRWSGKVVEEDVGDNDHVKVFNWEEAKKAVSVISSCPVSEPGGQIALTELEREVYCKVADIVKGNNLQVPQAISAVLHKFLDTCKDLWLTVFSMAVLSSDFKEGKAKGLTWNLLNSFQSFLVSRQASLAPPDMVLKDRVFFRFSRQPSVSILKLALKVFRLMENKLRYREAVVRMCEDGNFKTGCDVAVGLHLFDQFSVHIYS